jgi:hypothetical protein
MTKKKKPVPAPAPAPEADLLLAEEPATTPVGTLEPADPNWPIPSERVLSNYEILEEKIKIIDERLLALELANAKPEKPKAICVQEPC